MSLTCVGEREREREREREWARMSEEKTPPRHGGGGGGGCWGDKKKEPKQPNTLFISFLPTNALRLLKKKINKQEQHEQLKISVDRF